MQDSLQSEKESPGWLMGDCSRRWYTQKRDQLDSLVSIFEDHPLFKQLAGGDDAGEAHFNKMKQAPHARW